MHTVELLDEAIDLAKRTGFVVREEWLGGAPAGACEYKGRRWLFLDLALSPHEKLDVVLAALRSIPIPPSATIGRELMDLLAVRKAG
jgi:hypothetical protein